MEEIQTLTQATYRKEQLNDVREVRQIIAKRFNAKPTTTEILQLAQALQIVVELEKGLKTVLPED